MKSSHKVLMSVAAKMAHKYASVDASTMQEEVKKALWQSVANASSHKETGIMPFIRMLQQDQAAMNINVTRSGNSVTVSPPSLDKPEVASKYANLPGQIQAWLERNLEIFPTKRNGESVDYSNLTVTLEYPSMASQPVASQ
jgi:hypothetical protein